MKWLKDERGSSLVYLLWIITATIVLFLIVTNIARIYIVKQQASAAAELAALAATGEILVATEDAIKEFDVIMENLNEGGYEPLWTDIEERVDSLTASGYSHNEALIESYNELLPGRFGGEPDLKEIILLTIDNLTFMNRVQSTAEQIVKENEGNEESVVIKISTEKFRVEVKSDATYETLTDSDLLASFKEDIPQEGYGPPLDYLREVLN